MSNTGLYRVNRIKSKNVKKGYRFAYQLTNELLHADIRRMDLLDLKQEVMNRGLLWGIVEMDNAIATANEEAIDVRELEGRYGEKMTYAKQLQMEMRNQKKK